MGAFSGRGREPGGSSPPTSLAHWLPMVYRRAIGRRWRIGATFTGPSAPTWALYGVGARVAENRPVVHSELCCPEAAGGAARAGLSRRRQRGSSAARLTSEIDARTATSRVQAQEQSRGNQLASCKTLAFVVAFDCRSARPISTTSARQAPRDSSLRWCSGASNVTITPSPRKAPCSKCKMSSSTRPPLRLAGARDLRSRLVLATLARRPVEIRRLRADAERPGLRGDEASFVRLLDKLTSGSRISIDETGTTLRYSPGTLCGGSIEHDCGPSGRPIGWFLSALLPLAPFGAKPLHLTLKGVTCGNDKARSADALSKIAAPLLDKFGCKGCAIDVERREAIYKRQEAGLDEAGRVRYTKVSLCEDAGSRRPRCTVPNETSPGRGLRYQMRAGVSQ